MIERERSSVAQQVLAGAVVLAVVAGVEAGARMGWALADPRPVFLLAIVYAATFGGLVPAAAGVVATVAYAMFYFAEGGHAARSTLHGAPQAWTYVLIAPAVATLVLLKRRRSGAALARERGRSASAAADSAELNRAVLNSLQAHIAVLDAAGHVVATNQAWDRFASQNAASGAAPPGADGSAGAMVGSDYLGVCRRSTGAEAAQARSVAEGIESVLRGERPGFEMEYPCDSPTQRRWFLLNVTPLRGTAAAAGASAAGGTDGAGRRGVVVSHLDITERKEAERSVRQRAAELAAMARDLKRTNAELDQFAYITSHDLRAPLRGIANLSQWIEEDLAEQVTPETRKQLDLLRGRVHRMEAMIDGILQYSRVGRVRAAAERVDVGRLLAEVIDLLHIPDGFTVDVQAGMPVLVTERLPLQQVFMNLIGNAVKHHDKPSGTIRVGWREAAAADAQRYEFFVADDGPGIAPQYHDKVFVMFQTLQPRDRVEGTGVGLALVRKIVEDLGGGVTLESEAGRGTTFRFTWPKEPTPAAGAGAVVEAPTARYSSHA